MNQEIILSKFNRHMAIIQAACDLTNIQTEEIRSVCIKAGVEIAKWTKQSPHDSILDESHCIAVSALIFGYGGIVELIDLRGNFCVEHYAKWHAQQLQLLKKYQEIHHKKS